MDTQSRLALAADKLECAELVAKMARAIDRRDAALLASLFHPDATDDHGLFSGTATDFVAWVMPLLATMKQTQHVIGQSLIAVDGERAVGESYFIAHHTLAGPDGDLFMVAAGRYLDTFERRAGVWKVLRRHAVYDWNRTGASTDNFDRADPGPMAFGRADREDLSYAYFQAIGAG
ncbi:nuclear transport factor 2 family protein [uncultured Erythrobacter sp.]|uniref:nuclear transport factor 2 family protein n=1 Tax=uncultured Erythrobacter sp. TaxID=263913 RepID=UPI0026599D40|nr:nuclear transport factor 2 family protein [uncultured Erythrobacter sp.]